VPVNPSLVDDFDPATVPTVGELLSQLDRASAAASGTGSADEDAKGRKEDWEHTSLGPYVAMFEKHVGEILREARGRKRGESGVGGWVGGVVRAVLIFYSAQGGVYGLLRLVRKRVVDG
jgi:hypothetical protein